MDDTTSDNEFEGVVLRKKKRQQLDASVSSHPRPSSSYTILKYAILVLCGVAFVAFAAQLGINLRAIGRLAEQNGGHHEEPSDVQSNSKWFLSPYDDQVVQKELEGSQSGSVFTKLFNADFDFYEMDSDLRQARASVIVGAIFGILIAIVIAFGVWTDNFWICLICSTLLAIYGLCLFFKMTTIYEVLITIILMVTLIAHTCCIRFVAKIYSPVGFTSEMKSRDLP
ncbi:hypothetical protein HDE_01595 [Halotydeus destructor]|nr:hypothetical protein HDE_01595 [Halotydeus destructor]